MYLKIGQEVITSGLNKTINKIFLRNSQIIRTKTAYNNGKLYYKEWSMEKHAGGITKYFRSYSDNKPIPNSSARIDYKA